MLAGSWVPDGKTLAWMAFSAAVTASVLVALRPTASDQPARHRSAGVAVATGDLPASPTPDRRRRSRGEQRSPHLDDSRPNAGGPRALIPGQARDQRDDATRTQDSPPKTTREPAAPSRYRKVVGRDRNGDLVYGAETTLILDRGVSPEMEKILRKLDPEERRRVENLIQDTRDLRASTQGLQQENADMQRKMEEAGIADPPSPEDLASRGEVRFKLNDVALRDQPLSPIAVEELGLTDEQATGAEDIFRRSAGELQNELMDLYREQTGDPNAGGDLSLSALVDAIRDTSSQEDFEQAVRRIAAEQAGELDPRTDPSEESFAETMLRTILRENGATEQELSELLGPELASALLAHKEMKGTEHSYSVGSEGEDSDDNP